jgi:hypothetical protein
MAERGESNGNRALQGAAVGTATSALGAALIDLQPEGSAIAPVVTIAAGQLGLAAGGLGTSALVQYAPAPTRLVWWLLLGAFTVAVVAVLALPETVSGRPGVLAAQVAGSRDLLWGGLVIFLVPGTGAAGPVVFRGVSGPAACCLMRFDRS